MLVDNCEYYKGKCYERCSNYLDMENCIKEGSDYCSWLIRKDGEKTGRCVSKVSIYGTYNHKYILISIYFLFLNLFIEDERFCIRIGDICYNIENDCKSAEDQITCELYGAVIDETNFNVLECVWLKDDQNNISSNITIESKCILKV
jgi:hypothetical protein